MTAIRRVPGWQCLVVVAAQLAVVWVVVISGGGSSTALPHLFCVPILFAVTAYGARGGMVVVLAATVLAGPLMLEDSPDPVSWVVRGVMFAVVALAMAAALSARQAAQAAQVRNDLTRALHLDGEAPSGPDADLAGQVEQVLRERAFDIVFQPIYALPGGEVEALEALTRFRPEPCQPPDRWFAAADAVGLRTDLELAVIETALEAVAPAPRGLAVALKSPPPR